MDYQNTPSEPVKPKKMPQKYLSPIVWIVSIVVFCVFFTFSLAPRVKAQARGEQNSTSHYSSIIRTTLDLIQRNYIEEIDTNMLFEGAMSGMLNSLEDPYSAFLPESEMKDINDTTQGSFGGVGLYVNKPSRTDGRPNFLEVAAPIEDTPGWRAGINPGDLIIQINDDTTDLLTSDEAVAKLRGQPGTPVNLIIRRGERVEFPVTLVRAIIEVPTVKHDMIGDLGYLKLLTFTPNTVDRSRDAIRDFETKGYKGIILDLRNNYGGLLNAAVGVSNLFIEGGVVVSTKSRINSANQIYYARGRAIVPTEIPVIVLINRASASASEIVAGALKDRNRAYLVGEKSFGKGSVQQVYPLDKIGFKITIARYFTPSDVNIDRTGIPPDREVLFPEFSEAEADKFNSLINSGSIAEFVKSNPEANSAAIESFAQQLHREHGLETVLLKRLIRNEMNRTTIAPAYDLEYDVQLQEAVKILRDGNYKTLMQTTKTLKTLQEEAMRDASLLAS